MTNFDIVLHNLSAENKDVYLCGDFNIDILNGSNHSQTFVNILNSYALHPFIDKPTRISCVSSTLIDNILSNTENDMLPLVLYSDISDHLPIFLIFISGQRQTTFTNVKSFRKMNIENIQNFKSALESESWENVLSCNNANIAFTLFVQKLGYHLDQNIPKIKQSRSSKKPRKPWITFSILKSIRKRNKLYKKSLNNPTPVNITKYKQYRNILTSIIRNSKKTYFSEKFENTRGDMSATWKNINDLLGKTKEMNLNHKYSHGDIIYEKLDDIVNGFNEYFTNVGQQQASNIPSNATHFSTFLGHSCQSSLFLSPTDSEEIFKIVRNLKNRCSYGLDEISNNLLKNIISAIIDPFVHICNLSMSSGIFPSDMKIAKVIPIHKKEDHTLIANYRPISVLSSFSKILERLVYNRLVSFLSLHSLLNPCQYGFRTLHSADLALVDLFDKISHLLAKKEHVICVFMDLSKAFDTLDHKILLYKLRYFGINGTTFNWFESYISERQQYTCINAIRSKTRYINCGVPQGSILGPLLFISMI